MNEIIIGSLEGTLSKCRIAYQSQQILVNYFDSKCDGDKCRLFISLLKLKSMTFVRKILRIQIINSSEPSSHVFRSLVDAFSTIENKISFKGSQCSLSCVVTINHEQKHQGPSTS